MNRKMILVVATLVFVLFAGAVLAATNDVVSTFNTLNNDYFKGWDRGAREAAEALGLKYTGITTEGDSNKELTGIESSLVAGAKIFAVTPIGAQSVPTITDLVHSQGAFISITWDIPEWFTPLDVGDGFAAYLTPDSEEMAYQLAKLLFDEIGGEGRVIHITGLPGTTADLLVSRGVDRAAKEYPNIQVVGKLPGNFNRVDSQTVMENLMTSYPEFDAVFGQNDAVAIGALSAIENSNRPLVPVVGLDGTKEALELVKEGRLFATASAYPEWQGGYAVVRAFDAAQGYESSVAERMMYTGHVLITAENVDQYWDAIYGSEELPYDWSLMSRALNPDNWDPQNSIVPIDPTGIWPESSKPRGYEIPAEYLQAIEGGELGTVSKEYEEHYQLDILQ